MITVIQLKRRTARLKIPNIRSMVNMTTLIRNNGEMINSEMSDSTLEL